MSTTSPRARKALTKGQDVHERLTALAMRLGPAAKLPTIRELRRELGVSLTTLDSVLAQLEHQNIISRRQGAGIFVSPTLQQRCVGLVCEPAFFKAESSPFWHQLIQGARSRALIDGEGSRFYLAIPAADGEAPLLRDLTEDVQARRIQGVIFIGHNPAAVEWMERNGIAVVVFAGAGNYRVEIDVPRLITLSLEQLLARGCRKPALLVPWEVETEPPAEPLESLEALTYQAFLGSQGLGFHPELVWETRALGGRIGAAPATRHEQGYQAVLSLFAGGTVPDGLVSVDDMMTRGVVAGLRKLGLRPGHDVPLVSHINRGSTVLHGDDEGITLVEVDPAAIVGQLFGQLERLMDGETADGQAAVEHCVLVEPSLKG